jgi:hypothetical protein
MAGRIEGGPASGRAKIGSSEYPFSERRARDGPRAEQGRADAPLTAGNLVRSSRKANVVLEGVKWGGAEATMRDAQAAKRGGIHRIKVCHRNRDRGDDRGGNGRRDVRGGQPAAEQTAAGIRREGGRGSLLGTVHRVGVRTGRRERERREEQRHEQGKSPRFPGWTEVYHA